MASKNPTGDIVAKMLLNGGYNPCIKFPENHTFWTNNIGCDPGFVPDYTNGYCYMLLPTKKTFQEGVDHCADNYDAELLLFEKNSQVDGVIKMINDGKLLFFYTYLYSF